MILKLLMSCNLERRMSLSSSITQHNYVRYNERVVLCVWAYWKCLVVWFNVILATSTLGSSNK